MHLGFVKKNSNGLIITSDEQAIAQLMHFGLVPYCADSTKLEFSTLNARIRMIDKYEQFDL